MLPDFGRRFRTAGFRCKYGFWDCPWVWVNIETKVFGRGRPDVAYAGVIGGHTITIGEFMIIYRIYKSMPGSMFCSSRKDRHKEETKTPIVTMGVSVCQRTAKALPFLVK